MRYVKFVGMLMIYLHTRFYLAYHNSSLQLPKIMLNVDHQFLILNCREITFTKDSTFQETIAIQNFRSLNYK